MRDTVKIEGHTFTRQQVMEFKATVDKAIQELNTPEPIANLSRVQTRPSAGMGHLKGVVIFGNAQQSYTKGAGLSPYCTLTVITENGNGYSFGSEDALQRIWEVVK